MNALEMLESDYASKRAKIDRDMELARQLPTNGMVVSWVGEGGWDGNIRLPDVIKTCELHPWVFHSSSYLTQAKHISFKPPDEFEWTNGKGEHPHSKFRKTFELKYFKALLDAFQPFQVGLTACKGKYQGIFPTSFNFLEHKDFADAKTIGHGMCEIYTTRSVGRHGFVSGSFVIHVQLTGVGLIKVDLELPDAAKLAPHPLGIEYYANSTEIRSVQSWEIPKCNTPPIAAFKFGGGDSGNRTRSARYLFSTVDECMQALNIKFN